MQLLFNVEIPPYASRLVPGKVYHIGNYDMILLHEFNDECYMLLKDFYEKTVFARATNQYKDSHVDKICQKFATEIESIVGSENLIEHTVNYTSSDGSREYKPIKRKASLLTLDMFKECKNILKEHNPTKWWWLATPWKDTNCGVSYVSSDGSIGGIQCDYHNGGVRPFCILKSSILEAYEEDSRMNESFTKSDLKTGDVLLLKDGRVGIAHCELKTIIWGDAWDDLDAYNEGLKHYDREMCDIIAVRRPIKKGDCGFYAFDNNRGVLVYERNEPEEMTLEEVCKALGKKIKIVEKHS